MATNRVTPGKMKSLLDLAMGPRDGRDIPGLGRPEMFTASEKERINKKWKETGSIDSGVAEGFRIQADKKKRNSIRTGKW